MEVTMPRTLLKYLLAEAAELGANSALASLGVIKPYLSKQEAFTKYGRANVERWIKEELVTARKDGGHSAKWRIDRVEIEAVAKASNRPSYNQITTKGK